MFGKIEEGVDKEGLPTLRVRQVTYFCLSIRSMTFLHQVMGVVDVKQASDRELLLEWDSSASNDMIADSTLALITGIDKSPASVKRMSISLVSARAFH